METQTASVTGRLLLSYCQLHGQEPAGEVGARLPRVRMTHGHGPRSRSCATCSRTSLGSPTPSGGVKPSRVNSPDSVPPSVKWGLYYDDESLQHQHCKPGRAPTTRATQGAGSCLSPRHRGDNRSTGKVSNLSKVTQAQRGRAEMQTDKTGSRVRAHSSRVQLRCVHAWLRGTSAPPIQEEIGRASCRERV